MTNIPLNGSRVFWGVLTAFSTSGAAGATDYLSGNRFTAVSNIRLQWGNQVHEEAVTGTDIPYLGTGVYHGEVEVTSLGSSDNRWEQLVNLTSGQLVAFGMQWREDDSVSGRTWTCS